MASRRIIQVVFTAAVVIGAIWLFRDLDVARLRAALASAQPLLIVAAALANVTLNTAARTQRWRALLLPSPATRRAVGFFELAALLLASQATSNVLPFRAGEAVRTIGLRERHGYPFKPLIAAQVLEKPIEALSLAAVVLPMMLSAHAVAGSVRPALAVAFAGCLALWLGVRVSRLHSASISGTSFLHRWSRSLSDAVGVLRRPGVLLRGLLWSIASDIIDVAMIGLCLSAVGIHLPPSAWCVVLLAVNVAILIPVSPAQIGAFESGAVFALAGLGVDRSDALAFAFVYHAVHLLPTTAVGGLCLAILRPSRPRRCNAT